VPGGTAARIDDCSCGYSMLVWCKVDEVPVVSEDSRTFFPSAGSRVNTMIIAVNANIAAPRPFRQFNRQIARSDNGRR